jgi:pantothenate kinase, type III
MLLAIDIGNTNTTLGLFDGDALVADFRLHSDRDRTSDEYAALIASLLLTRGLSLAQIDGVAMAYVVPPVGDALRDLAHRHLKVEPLVVTSETDSGLTLRYLPPSAVGADRIVNAVAAWELFGRESPTPRPACIVVDYGTATTFDAVSPNAEYLGGAILPGIGISLDALFSHAALLSRVELLEPASAIGQNTADALRSGILYGYAAQTDGMVRRFREELSAGGAEVRVIATGGIAPLIAPYTETLEVVDVNLTLTGLRLLWERNQRHRVV